MLTVSRYLTAPDALPSAMARSARPTVRDIGCLMRRPLVRRVRGGVAAALAGGLRVSVRAFVLVSMLVSMLAGCQARAADSSAVRWPQRPVHLIVSTAAGGASDIMARLLGERLQPLWGEQVLVENRTGGGAVIATEAVVRAAPDGHVLGLLASSFVVTSALRDDMPYIITRDLRAVTHVGSAPALLVSRADFPASAAADVIALARARPGQLSYGSPSINSNGHRAGEVFKRDARIDLVHVPFKGGAPATAALLGGQIDLMMATPPGFQQHIASGRLKVIGVSSARRFPAFPDAPTFAESGLPGFDRVEWWLVVAPARTPAALVDRIYRDVATATRSGDFHARMLDLGIETFAASPAESARFLAAEIERWGREARSLGLTP